MRIFLGEKNRVFKLEEERFWDNRPTFLTLNPSGQLPVMIEGGKVFCDCNAICEYIDEVYTGDLSLYPPDPVRKAEVRRLVTWFSNKFYNEVTKIIINERIVKFCKKIGTPDSHKIRIATNNLTYHLEYLTCLLSKRTHVADDAITAADIAAAAQISTLDYLGEIPWQHYNAVKLWYAPIKSRPSFRKISEDRYAGFVPPREYSLLDF